MADLNPIDEYNQRPRRNDTAQTGSATVPHSRRSRSRDGGLVSRVSSRYTGYTENETELGDEDYDASEFDSVDSEDGQVATQEER